MKFLATPLMQNGGFQGYGYYRIILGTHTLDVELTRREMASSPSPAPIQKHSLGGYTADRACAPSNCHGRGMSFRRCLE